MPDNAPSQGGAPATPAAPAAPAPVSTGDQQHPQQLAVSRSEVNAFVARLIGSHGTADAALLKVVGEQIRYRKRAQAAEARAVAAEGKLNGAVVLSADEAKVYNELKAAGVTLDKVPAALSRLKTLETDSATKSMAENLDAAVGKKYKIPALKKLLPADVVLEFDTVKVKGKDKDGKDTIEDTKEAYVATTKDGVKTREKLDQYLEREIDADLLNVIKVSEQAPDPKKKGSSSNTHDRSGLSVPRQQSTTQNVPRGDKKDDVKKVVQSTLGARYQTPGQRAKAATAAKDTDEG
jgi:hypothetical protein